MGNVRVLLVPDSIYWVTGTIAASFARYNPWMRAAIVSGPVLDDIAMNEPGIADRFDFVHFVCPYAARYWVDRLRTRVPVITSHHHVTDWDAVKHNLLGDCIIAGSSEWARDIIARGADPSRVVCIPYGVDANKFAPSSAELRRNTRQRLGFVDAAPVIGFFGKRGSNDDDRKGTDIFIDAVIQLEKLVPGSQVLIVGPGWQDLIKKFRAAGIRHVWIPFVRNVDALAPLHGALDFYWVTARVEGGPVPLLEAMSSGVTCVTTPVGLARDIVVDGSNAMMIEKDQAEPFATLTAALWHDSQKRIEIGARARETILEQMRDRDTSREVFKAYEIAARAFAERNPGRAAVKISREPVPRSAAPTSATVDDISLEGLPIRLHKRTRMLESLAWAENLVLYQQQRGAALSLIWNAWLSNPTSLAPARTLLRRFLPGPLVRKVVKVKRFLSRARPLPVSQEPSTQL